MQTITSKPIYKISLCAIMIALATALSMIPGPVMPFGGKITFFGMFPIIMVSLLLDFKWGILSAFIFSLLNMLFIDPIQNYAVWQTSPKTFIACMVFDYLIAFTVLGLAGLFSKKGYWGICLGAAFVMILRYCSHIIAGVTIWKGFAEGYFFGISLANHPLLYSMLYNSFLLPEFIGTVILVAILFRLPQIKRLMSA